MKNYDYHRPAEKVLLDSYRKQNRNKNRLLFLAVALTVGVIFCMISFAYGKIQVDIQKHIRTDGMTVSTYIENGTEEMAGQLHTLSYIAETGKEKFAGKLCNQTIKYCDCVVADETAFETMLCPAYTQIVGTYPKQENETILWQKNKTFPYRVQESLAVARRSLHTDSSREALIKSLFAFILEFLCNARNEATRIASYLRSLMTKQCMKILIKANSMN